MLIYPKIMKNIHFKITAKITLIYLIISVLSLNLLYANKKKDRYVLSKKSVLNFSAKAGTKLDIFNKYGTVVINTWQSDSIVVEVHVEARAKQKSDAQRILDRVEITHQQYKNDIRISSEFDTNQNEIIEWVRAFWQTAKNLVLDENNLQVNYTIYMPESANLIIENKFGDIIFGGDMYGELEVNLLHGNLKAEYIEGMTFLDMKFVKAEITYIKKSEIDIKFGNLEVKEATNLKLKNLSADVEIKKVQNLTITTRNARLAISEVDTLSGNSVFGRITVEKVNYDLSLDMQFGYLHIDSLPPSFQVLDVKAKSTDIDVVIGKKTNYQLELTGQNKHLTLPTYLQYIDRKNIGDRNVTISAFVGKQKSTKIIKIKADKGTLLIE